MNEQTDSQPSSSLFPEFPNYQPLSGTSASQAHTLLLRKGGMLEPALSRSEAQEMVSYMRLERFAAGTLISFHTQNSETGRLMLILAGEASIRLRSTGNANSTKHSPVDQNNRWRTVTEGATLGLIHAFSGLSSRVVAQAHSELFVASLPREQLSMMKKRAPSLAMRFFEMLSMELALVALDHERRLEAMNNVARSLQGHIDDESDKTRPAPLI